MGQKKIEDKIYPAVRDYICSSEGTVWKNKINDFIQGSRTALEWLRSELKVIACMVFGLSVENLDDDFLCDLELGLFRLLALYKKFPFGKKLLDKIHSDIVNNRIIKHLAIILAIAKRNDSNRRYKEAYHISELDPRGEIMGAKGNCYPSPTGIKCAEFLGCLAEKVRLGKTSLRGRTTIDIACLYLANLGKSAKWIAKEAKITKKDGAPDVNYVHQIMHRTREMIKKDFQAELWELFSQH